VSVHGAVKGSWLSLKRICRCHPWGGCGCDPVPPKKFNSDKSRAGVQSSEFKVQRPESAVLRVSSSASH
jgi:putative component of membrane protein insertase Oxa1/YidC/SpoIIIJ protein YidD